ncbi:MAG: hypothetical protein JXB32_20930 [Deltaproteobacteria bacterium]|nr:hypothetical protein [Deltaproteobacteria bacterium]
MTRARFVARVLVAAACLLGLAACRGGGKASDVAGKAPTSLPAAPAAELGASPSDDAAPGPARTTSADAATPGAADAAPPCEASSVEPGDAPPVPAEALPDPTADAGSPDVPVPEDASSADVPADGGIPFENRAQGERPDAASAEALARRLLAACVADDPAPVTDLVFPVGPFSMLKDLPDPAAYQRRLVRWFEEDLHAARERLGRIEALEFRGFRFGRCEWVPKWGEGNLIPYWSCRRNRITAFTGRREVEVEIRVLINWGRDWYVTHLGPVRQ